MFLEVSGDGDAAFLHVIGIGKRLLARIKAANQIFVWSVHTNQESASTKLSVVLFIYVVTGKLVHLIDNEVPAAQVEVTHAEVNALYAHVGDNALKPLGEMGFQVVIDTSHVIAVFIGYNNH